jgi:hypothetical protein
VKTPVRSEVFGPPPVWLYDEFDKLGPGTYRHEILLADGRVISLRFHEFHYHVAQSIAQAIDDGRSGRLRKSRRAAS